MTRSRLRLLVSAFSLVLLASPGLAEDWPQFRGLNASGVSSSTSLPTEFSAKTARWKATLGDGVSCPVVCAGRVFNTAMTGPETFSVFAHDAATGKPLWKTDFATGRLPRITPPNSHASSTPAVDGDRICVYFSTLGLLALDVATGKELWRHPLPRAAYLMDWGTASSPIITRNTVYFLQDDDLSPYLIAVDLTTGKQRWKTPRPDMLAGYAVPVLCEAGGRTDLVISGTGKLIGYDLATGKELWTCKTLLRTMMTSPVVKDGIIYLSSQSYGDANRTLKFALLEWLDTNQDGKLERVEIPKEFAERFDTSDKNKDGILSGEEIDTAFQHPSNMVGGGNTIQAVKGGGTGDVTKTHVLWNLNNRSPSNLSSPLVYNGRLLVVKSGGLSSSFETAAGKTLWQLERIRNFGDYFASPVAGDGKIYVAGRNGFVVVLADSAELKILARNDMGGELIATPAIAQGCLYFRTRDAIVCVP